MAGCNRDHESERPGAWRHSAFLDNLLAWSESRGKRLDWPERRINMRLATSLAAAPLTGVVTVCAALTELIQI